MPASAALGRVRWRDASVARPTPFVVSGTYIRVHKTQTTARKSAEYTAFQIVAGILSPADVFYGKINTPSRGPLSQLPKTGRQPQIG